MRVLRYGASATWIFRGYETPPVETAFLTIKDAWASEVEEQAPPSTERLQLAVTPALSDVGIVTTDEDGNWVAIFNLSADETTADLAPIPRVLFYEVTLIVEGDLTLRPVVGRVRMLADVYTPASSS